MPFAYDPRVRILVDRDIPDGPRLFAALGDVRPFDGRAISPAEVADADALIVRSVTRVDKRLLAGSRVAFVGTATSGEDHVDTGWLERQGIAFASAAGCNSEAVADHLMTALVMLAVRRGVDPRGWTIGVVGVGRIGSIVARRCRRLGMGVLLCDPPRERYRPPQDSPPFGGTFLDLRTLVRQADVVSLHVPLTTDGPDATLDLLNADVLGAFRRGVVLINTSRGEVVDESALKEALRSGGLGGAVVDVWRGEPRPDAGLIGLAEIATPHIAGYSAAARQRAGTMIRDQLAAWMVNENPPTHADRLPVHSAIRIPQSAIAPAPAAWPAPRSATHMTLHDWSRVAGKLNEIKGLDGIGAAMRALAGRDPDGRRFDALRASCAGRAEFSSRPADGAAGDVLRALGWGEE